MFEPLNSIFIYSMFIYWKIIIIVLRDRSTFIEAGDRCEMHGDKDFFHVFK